MMGFNRPRLTGEPWRFSPWHIEEGPPAVLAGSGWIVCTTSSDDHAKVIAAAPELLDALLLVWDTYGMDSSIDSAIWQTVQAALKKATI